MDEQPLFAQPAPPAAATVPGVVHPHRFLDRPLLSPRYLLGAAYYGHAGDALCWSLRLYARIIALVRQLFPDELPLYTRFNPLDSGDMAEAIGWLHQLVNDNLFPIADHSADDGYFYDDGDNDDLPQSLYWLTPSVLGVNYDTDYAASFYDDTQIGAFGTRGVVDFMMTLAADEIGDVNPYDAQHIPDTPFGIARYHYGSAPPDGFSLTNALRGIGCITLPHSYEALPLLLRIVLKQTGNTFVDISEDALWEARRHRSDSQTDTGIQTGTAMAGINPTIRPVLPARANDPTTHYSRLPDTGVADWQRSAGAVAHTRLMPPPTDLGFLDRTAARQVQPMIGEAPRNAIWAAYNSVALPLKIADVFTITPLLTRMSSAGT